MNHEINLLLVEIGVAVNWHGTGCVTALSVTGSSREKRQKRVV
jgi:hypothetical protein